MRSTGAPGTPAASGPRNAPQIYIGESADGVRARLTDPQVGEDGEIVVRDSLAGEDAWLWLRVGDERVVEQVYVFRATDAVAARARHVNSWLVRAYGRPVARFRNADARGHEWRCGALRIFHLRCVRLPDDLHAVIIRPRLDG